VGEPARPKMTKKRARANVCGEPVFVLAKSSAATRNRHGTAPRQTRPSASAEPVLPAAEQERPGARQQPAEEEPLLHREFRTGPEHRSRRTGPAHSKREPEHNMTAPERNTTARGPARSKWEPAHSNSGPEHRNHSPSGDDGGDDGIHMQPRTRTHPRSRTRDGGREQCSSLRAREWIRPQRPESTTYETSVISSTCGTLETRTP
jgi:hypothetical protein